MAAVVSGAGGPTAARIAAVLFDIGDTLVHAAPPGTAVAELRVAPIGNVVAELTELGRRYRLGAVTDTSVMSGDDVRRVLAGSGLDDLLEVVVSSVDVGAAKPDPRGLVVAMTRLGVSADETLFVGDADVDEQAARTAGVRFVRAGGGRSPGPRVAATLAAIGWSNLPGWYRAGRRGDEVRFDSGTVPQR
ncbi:MAG: HAD hydrolase-like protein [Acidimicrobiales bacterium]